MPETRPPLNRRRARLLRLLWDQWDRNREAHRPSSTVTTSSVWTAWYRTPEGDGPSRAVARKDLAHLASAGHLVACRSDDGHRYYRLNTETVDRAGLWLIVLPTNHPAFVPLDRAAARQESAVAERLMRTAFQRAFNTAAGGYPLPALDAHAERLHNAARAGADRIEAQGFDLGVTAARIALAHRNTEHAATA
ncbi:hypothetical protein [Streptomyces cavernae]|uniref:hypothetical protein n=1 Tax=Streptomyces cavernae TaxID=2259034 RepID=UPI000FEBDD9B|nr:hypothetical protein [Streptomyces cavernae]